MARKYINLFDEQGNLVRVPLGADAENVDLEAIIGLNSTNVQSAFAELLTKLAQKQGILTSGQNITISEQGVISSQGGGGFIDNETIGNLYDADIIDVALDSERIYWKTDKKVVENNNSLTEVDVEGYRSNKGSGTENYISISSGDLLITNADTDGVLLMTSTNKLCDGRNKFDGEYIVYKASSDELVYFSYKADVEYDVHVFVIHRNLIEVKFRLYAGYLNGSFGYADQRSTTSAYVTGITAAITDYITITNSVGKYLFIPEGIIETLGTIYTKYKALPQDPSHETSSDVKSFVKAGKTWGVWDKPYIIIPITENEEIYRIQFKKAAIPTARAYLVTKEWLQCYGYADQWAGKKWAMYGDSYVAGQSVSPTWHDIFARNHFVDYTNLGTGGIGLMVNASENIVGSLLSHIEDTLLENGEPLDVDVIGITCGRNDYSAGVPIGDIDDMVEEPIPYNPRVYPDTNYSGDATFMGGLNYLCKWLLDNYTGKRIFFVTPWYFLDDKESAIATPVEYVNAVKSVAGKWGIPCFDAARQSGISVQNETFRSTYFLSSVDTSHLNRAGHWRMALGPVCKWLENLFIE